eukprot:XP_001696170.1 predicted protein [Chlamydomonas reinhardtii]
MSNNNTSWGSGQPVGLPPVAGASKEGDEQRGVAKIKPIPLLLSTRMIQANAAPSAVARGAGRPSTSQQPYHPGATATGSGGGAAPALGFGDAGAGPGSPAGRHMPGAPSISGMASLVLGASRPTTTTNVNGANGANGANGYGMSPPMTAGSGGSRPRTRGASAGTLADLSAALQKSIAAGMGEWDLTADGLWGHPEVQERLLRGPLGPEVLKHRYRMEELLENVFRAYASLWDEALMIVFDSEMAAVLAEKTAALQALDAGVARLADFVTQNIDNMLATRHMKHATNAMEGQLHSLSAANDQLVTHMAGHAVQSHVVTLKGVVGDQNATLSGQFFQPPRHNIYKNMIV